MVPQFGQNCCSAEVRAVPQFAQKPNPVAIRSPSCCRVGLSEDPPGLPLEVCDPSQPDPIGRGHSSPRKPVVDRRHRLLLAAGAGSPAAPPGAVRAVRRLCMIEPTRRAGYVSNVAEPTPPGQGSSSTAQIGRAGCVAKRLGRPAGMDVDDRQGQRRERACDRRSRARRGRSLRSRGLFPDGDREDLPDRAVARPVLARSAPRDDAPEPDRQARDRAQRRRTPRLVRLPAAARRQQVESLRGRPPHPARARAAARLRPLPDRPADPFPPCRSRHLGASRPSRLHADQEPEPGRGALHERRLDERRRRPGPGPAPLRRGSGFDERSRKAVGQRGGRRSIGPERPARPHGSRRDVHANHIARSGPHRAAHPAHGASPARGRAAPAAGPGRGERGHTAGVVHAENRSCDANGWESLQPKDSQALSPGSALRPAPHRGAR